MSGWPGAERRKHDAVDGKNEINRFWLFDKATHMTAVSYTHLGAGNARYVSGGAKTGTFCFTQPG